MKDRDLSFRYMTIERLAADEFCLLYKGTKRAIEEIPLRAVPIIYIAKSQVFTGT